MMTFEVFFHFSVFFKVFFHEPYKYLRLHNIDDSLCLGKA